MFGLFISPRLNRHNLISLFCKKTLSFFLSSEETIILKIPDNKDNKPISLIESHPRKNKKPIKEKKNRICRFNNFSDYQIQYI